MYSNGIGLTKGYQQAKYWYEKASVQNDVDAQFLLGEMYDDGLGVRQDYHQARAWYEKAASQNDAQAQFDIGVMNELGQRGRSKTLVRAIMP